MTTAGSTTTPNQKQGGNDADGNALQQGEPRGLTPLSKIALIFVPVAIVAAVILLVGLPLGALGIVHYSGCCFADGPEDVVTFWAALTAGFLALFGGLITAVFIITAFRIDTTAKMEARLQADKALDTYLRRYKDNVIKQIEDVVEQVSRRGHNAKAGIEKCEKEVRKGRDTAKDMIEQYKEEVERRRNAANDAIGRLQDQVAKEAETAKQSIETLQSGVATDAGAARRSIVEVRDGIVSHRDQAIRTIDSAVEAVETAARDARTRIEQAGRQPPPKSDEGDSNA